MAKEAPPTCFAVWVIVINMPEKRPKRTGAQRQMAEEVVECLKLAIRQGTPWPRALLDAVAAWPLAEERLDGVDYRYLLLGEAFDWLTLAGRLLSEVDGLVPAEERTALLFEGSLPSDELWYQFENLIGPEKRGAHLNYYYGVIVEEALLLSVEETVRKERISQGLPDSEDLSDIAFRRIYGETEESLLQAFRQEMARPDSDSITITELKEFTYWLFKRRVNSSESARVASDTKKGLVRLSGMNGLR